VLLWLAILREPATLDELSAVLVKPVSRSQILEAVEALYLCSLIERGQTRGFTAIRRAGICDSAAHLEASAEIQDGKLARLVEHGLELLRPVITCGRRKNA
jgi:hypothetical protein